MLFFNNVMFVIINAEQMSQKLAILASDRVW